jgi:deoxycytidylate deaminase
MPTGEGYEMCKNICKQTSHAEVAAIKAAGKWAAGGRLYLEGHTYACRDCAAAMVVAGICELIVGQPPEEKE